MLIQEWQASDEDSSAEKSSEYRAEVFLLDDQKVFARCVIRIVP